MAKFNIFLMRLLLVTMTLAAAAAYVEVKQISPTGEDNAYPPENTDNLPPEQSPEESKFLDACVQHFTRECGREIFVNILADSYGPLSDKCCSELVAVGETCHITMVKALFAVPDFKSKASSGIPKSKKIWNECASIVSEESPSPSPIPFEI